MVPSVWLEVSAVLASWLQLRSMRQHQVTQFQRSLLDPLDPPTLNLAQMIQDHNDARSRLFYQIYLNELQLKQHAVHECLIFTHSKRMEERLAMLCRYNNVDYYHKSK